MKINAAFSLLPGQAVSIRSATLPHPTSGIEMLVVAQIAPASFDVQNDTALLTDNPLIERYDVLWDNQLFPDALKSYQQLQASERLIIDDSVAEYHPDNVIEVLKQRQNGTPEYNIDVLQNGHLALLATCLFFHRQMTFQTASNFLDRLSDTILTI